MIRGDVLELGCGYGGQTCEEIIRRSGCNWLSTDMDASGVKVDYLANFETGYGVEHIAKASGGFDTLLILNVLEHVFEPIKILDNARSLLRPGGVLITATPCVWPIHNCPVDCARLLPDWYRRYAERSGLQLLGNQFVFIGYGRIDEFRSKGTDCFPSDRRMIGWAGLRSRIVHKLFNTSGRGMLFRPHIAIGAAFKAAT